MPYIVGSQEKEKFWFEWFILREKDTKAIKMFQHFHVYNHRSLKIVSL